jgi:phosphatidylserine/phosphatidylglycerophosphate/cardiolipin synthase-like enzyme
VLLSAAIGGVSAIIGVTPGFARSDAAAPDGAKVEVAFTPGDDVAGMIVRRIGQARRSVQMQAYLFTDRRIANALLAARKRGVEVEIVGDAAQQASGGLPHLKALARAGARVFLDAGHAAAHDKVLILDGAGESAAVITGSYNFTVSAQSRNGENVVVISGNPAVTARFVANFEKHRRESTPWR